MVVGKAEFIATHRAGHRQAHRAYRARGQLQRVQVQLDGIFRAGEVCRGQHTDRMQLVVFPQRKTCVGTANITDQSELHLRFSRDEVKVLAPCSAELKA